MKYPILFRAFSSMCLVSAVAALGTKNSGKGSANLTADLAQAATENDSDYELGTVVLGKGTHDLSPVHSVHGPNKTFRHLLARPGLARVPVSAGEWLDKMLAQTNQRLTNCRVAYSWIGAQLPDTPFQYEVRAIYSNGVYTQDWLFEGNLASSTIDASEYLLSLIPNSMFFDCHKKDASEVEHLIGDSSNHLARLVTALNSQLESCTIRSSGTVTDADSNGDYRFFLEAAYSDGTVDPKIHFETNANNDINHDVTEFLGLIPSQAFSHCRRRSAPPPTPTPPVPPPTPTPPVPPPTPPPANNGEAMRNHVDSMLFFAGQRFEKCTLFRDGDIGNQFSDGSFEFFVNARYLDGTTESKRIFRTSLTTPIQDKVAEMVGLIPQQMFAKCVPTGIIPPIDPQRDAARTFVATTLSKVNDRLDNCIVVLSGRVGTVDPHGDFFFYLMAYVKDDGAFTEPARFQANLNLEPDGAALMMLRLIPQVEFSKCRIR